MEKKDRKTITPSVFLSRQQLKWYEYYRRPTASNDAAGDTIARIRYRLIQISYAYVRRYPCGVNRKKYTQY
jgi:hypothetical protein